MKNTDRQQKIKLWFKKNGWSDAYIEKNVNLAQKLSDGTKIYIPSKTEQPGPNSISIINASSNGLISINSASAQKLEELSGIGPVTAGEIIDGRPHNSIQDLLDKKIVGQKTFDKIKEQISL